MYCIKYVFNAVVAAAETIPHHRKQVTRQCYDTTMSERPSLVSSELAITVQGSYESVPTDTQALARALAQPKNLYEVVRKFDVGETPVRDVGRLTRAERHDILTAYERRQIGNLWEAHPEIITKPVTSLRHRVLHGERDQPIGHNFFENYTGFLDYPWAHDFGTAIHQDLGYRIDDIRRLISAADKDRVLVAITRRPRLTIPCAVYLAGRSLASEQYVESIYGRMLSQTKLDIGDCVGELAQQTRLRHDMLVRCVEQLGRTRFTGFDHLRGLVTSGNTGVDGDYSIGSLSIEIQFAGTVSAPQFPTPHEARRIICHELNHAASAQSAGQIYCGLYLRGHGNAPNEGMTEYLAHRAIRSSGLRREADGRITVETNVAYRAPTAAMFYLHHAHPQHFASLFRAYHGDVPNIAELEQALATFYRCEATIARQLGNP
jgi:hypothetical protein